MKQEKRKTTTDVSRRDFVRKTAVGLGGVGAAALAGLGATGAEAAEIPKRWDRVADVVVAGAGAAGLPAAIEAAQNGASVTLGGGTSLQQKFGIEDSPDRYFSDLVRRIPETWRRHDRRADGEPHLQSISSDRPPGQGLSGRHPRQPGGFEICERGGDGI